MKFVTVSLLSTALVVSCERGADSVSPAEVAPDHETVENQLAIANQDIEFSETRIATISAERDAIHSAYREILASLSVRRKELRQEGLQAEVHRAELLAKLSVLEDLIGNRQPNPQPVNPGRNPVIDEVISELDATNAAIAINEAALSEVEKVFEVFVTLGANLETSTRQGAEVKRGQRRQ